MLADVRCVESCLRPEIQQRQAARLRGIAERARQVRAVIELELDVREWVYHPRWSRLVDLCVELEALVEADDRQ